MIEPEVEAKQYLSIEVRRRQPKDYIMGKGYMLARSFPETTHLGTASMEAQHSIREDLVLDHETGKMTYSRLWRASGLGQKVC